MKKNTRNRREEHGEEREREKRTEEERKKREQRKKDTERERRKQAHRGGGSDQTPTYWTDGDDAVDGFVLQKMKKDGTEWKALEACLDTRLDWLGYGKDGAKGACAGLKLAGWWRI